MLGRAAFSSLVLILTGAHDAEMELGTLGVPGYPDCFEPAGGFSSTNVAVRAMEMECVAKPKTADQISIACVGDSITAGVCSSGGETYPSQLQKLLGSKYVVTNFGACGSTMQKNADSPYWKRPQYPALLKSNADIVVIMLGTNDAKSKETHGASNWENDGKTGAAQFEADYKSMIDIIKNFTSKPTIYTMIPPPLNKPNVYGMNQTVINEVFPRLIQKINSENNLPHPPIDVFNAMGGASMAHADWFCDGCHPVNVGYQHLAAAVQKGLGLGDSEVVV